MRAEIVRSQKYPKSSIFEAMIVPRAFRYGNGKDMITSTQDEKVEMSKPETPRKPRGNKGRVNRPSKMIRIGSVPAATPSAPVIIPTRSQSVNKRLDEFVSEPPQGEQDSKCVHRLYEKNTAATKSPGTTSISPVAIYPRSRMPTAFRKRGSGLQVIEGIDPEAPRNTLSSLSPRSWDLLQSLPEGGEIDILGLGNDIIQDSSPFYRSSSTSSLLSLENDRSSSTFSSNPSTPGNTPRKLCRRKKSLSSSFAEDCGEDHPLSLPTNHEVNDRHVPSPSDAEASAPDIAMPTIRSRLSFKSNLTASLRQIKSAARSFSNFNTLSSQHGSAYNRSVLLDSPHLTDDRRPVLLEDIPGPALRRYLNPIVNSQGHSAEDSCKGSIQMQTYQKTPTTSTTATSPPIFTPSAHSRNECDLSTYDVNTSRQREPRVNSDFLRMIVLEMNMRKAGKLKIEAPGRARIYLPPREATKSQTSSSNVVPTRWSGIVT